MRALLSLAVNIIGGALVFGVFILAAVMQVRLAMGELEKHKHSPWYGAYLKFLVFWGGVFIVAIGGAAFYFMGKVLLK